MAVDEAFYTDEVGMPVIDVCIEFVCLFVICACGAREILLIVCHMYEDVCLIDMSRDCVLAILISSGVN